MAVAVGCTTPEDTIALIEQSERVAVDYPDSAMLLIARVNPDRVRGKQDKAHYRLALSEALYYNRIDSDCDSLTRPLFDYYYDSDRHAERARAMYQHGLVMFNGSNHAESMYALMEAEKSLQYCDNPRLLALVYRTMGDIYGSECLYENALTAYKRVYDIFDTLSLEFHSVYSLFNIGEIYIKLNEYRTAEEYLMAALTKSLEIGYDEIYCHIADRLCSIYVFTSCYGDIERYIDALDDGDLYDGFEIQMYYYNAILCSHNGYREQALKYLDMADACPNTNIIEAEYFKSIVYQNLGDNEQAVYWLQQNKIQQEQLLLSILELPILNTQIELLEQDINIAMERAKNLRFRYVIVFMLFLFSAICIAFYVRHKMIMQQHEIERYISMISELKQNYARNSSKILDEVQSVYDNKLSDLNTLLEAYYEHSNTSRESYKIAEQVKTIVNSMSNDSDSIAQLERLVNLHYNNVVATIKDSNVRFSAKELKYVIYMLSGLSNRSMCLLLNIDDAALYRIKYKVKNKMIECGLEDDVTKIFSRR